VLIAGLAKSRVAFLASASRRLGDRRAARFASQARR
jgi:hypothetical protein